MVKTFKTSEEFGLDLAREVGDFIFSTSQDNLVEGGQVDTSNLLLSGGIKEEKNEVVITYDAPYASDVNDGTDPHFVDPKELEGWVRRQVFQLKYPEGHPKIKARAKSISNAILKRGTIAHPYIDSAIEAAKVKFKLID